MCAQLVGAPVPRLRMRPRRMVPQRRAGGRCCMRCMRWFGVLHPEAFHPSYLS